MNTKQCPDCDGESFMIDGNGKALCINCAEEMETADKRLSMKESVDKVRVTGKLKRGTGTRDQDTLKIEARGRDADEATDEFESALEQLDATVDTMREFQAGDGE